MVVNPKGVVVMVESQTAVSIPGERVEKRGDTNPWSESRNLPLPPQILLHEPKKSSKTNRMVTESEMMQKASCSLKGHW